MGFLSIVVPQALLPNDTVPHQYVLSLGFDPGFFSKPRWPSFPLTLCGALPRYSLKAKLIVKSGKGWDHNTVGPQWFYIDDRIYCEKIIRPEEFLSGDWVVDSDHPWPFSNGLQIVWNPPTSPGGHGEHNEDWTTAKDSYKLWIGGHGGNNSHPHAIAAVKRVKSYENCGLAEADSVLDYTDDNQLRLSTSTAIGVCDASLQTPTIFAEVTILTAGVATTRNPINLPVPSSFVKALGGQVSLYRHGRPDAHWSRSGGGYRIKE